MRVYIHCLVTALLGATVACGQAPDAPPDPTNSDDGTQILTRGPVHEAFAGTVSFNPEPGILSKKAPPEAIEELPPDQKPEGANVAWIPGYWAWDDERNDFLWVSGVWRALPPGRQWVSGYWGKTTGGSQWTSGYWADAKASEVEYLPEPPDSVESGPNIAASSEDHIWLPGCWMWNQNRYAWRPGYWTTAQPNWVWIPSCYVWAPRGYVYVDGYWDYEVARRGVLFAPVYFNAGVYSRSGFRYSPSTVISLSVFSDHLFSRPRYHHYYFGDYYGNSYQTSGYHSSHSNHSRRGGYDPIYAHQRWQHRKDKDWEQGVEAKFQHRRDHEDARPPRTWEAQRALARSEAGSREAGRLVAAPLEELANSPDSPIRFQRVDKQERQKYAERGQQVRKFREERQQLESRAATAAEVSGDRPGKGSQPRRGRLTRSPIVAPTTDELGKDQAPPKSDRAPDVDPKVEPKPRRPAGNAGRPNVETRPDRPNAEPRPDRPKVEAKPERPKANPRPDAPKARPRPERPRAEARPERPQAGKPQPTRPKAEARPEPPAVEPKPDRPKADPRPDAPKVQPRPERPRPEARPERPKEESRPDRPKAESRPERPQAAKPQPARPKAEARPQRPKAEAKPPRPQAKQQAPRPNRQPQVKREAPKREPRNEKPARESKGAPKGETKGKAKK